MISNAHVESAGTIIRVDEPLRNSSVGVAAVVSQRAISTCDWASPTAVNLPDACARPPSRLALASRPNAVACAAVAVFSRPPHTVAAVPGPATLSWPPATVADTPVAWFDRPPATVVLFADAVLPVPPATVANWPDAVAFWPAATV